MEVTINFPLMTCKADLPVLGDSLVDGELKAPGPYVTG
jgi:hypothetical protein